MRRGAVWALVRLLGIGLPAEEREFYVGDVLEEFELRRRRAGASARFWLAREAASGIATRVAGRLGHVLPGAREVAGAGAGVLTAWCVILVYNVPEVLRFIVGADGTLPIGERYLLNGLAFAIGGVVLGALCRGSSVRAAALFLVFVLGLTVLRSGADPTRPGELASAVRHAVSGPAWLLLIAASGWVGARVGARLRERRSGPRRPAPSTLVQVACAGVVAAAGADPVVAQEAGAGSVRPVVIPHSEVRTLESAHGVEYELRVALPSPGTDRGTDPDPRSGRTYPVVYLLDADYSFAIVRNALTHLAERGDVPPVIVVGIAYAGPARYRLNRTRDYTPTFVPSGGYGPEYQAHSGGAPAFQRFILGELDAYIRREFPARAERYLVGHSYGGLFAIWSALTEPEGFDGIVAVSPSLWYDDHMVLDLQRASLTTGTSLPFRLFMAVGSREVNAERDMVDDLRALATAFDEAGPPGLALRWSVLEDETHNSVFPGAVTTGLRFVLRGR